MNVCWGKSDPPRGLSGSALQQQATPSKPNRLRRSFRPTQQTQTAAEVDPPESQQPDFKTPTRIPRPRSGGGFSGESPHNDSDLQQDIIWDATSPSPRRLGKRGKKQPAGVVNISEIVSRIAPKHGRPKAAEPTLQQWIGDSATIPCTPDVQVPKPKKKSPRPNGVDDLLKLAKQFDFNMFRQDEEEVEELHQQSLELLSEDILDISPCGDSHPAVKATAATAAGSDVKLHQDQYLEDDLDFLFDGPTQHVSGSLSQVSTAQPSRVKPASKDAPGKPCAPSHGCTSGVSTPKDEFEDDWENDDLLNDSLVLEMTQNPQNFIAPKHCSTQKPPSQVKYQHAANVRSGVLKVEKDNVRRTFRLESNPNLSVKGIQTDTWTKPQDYGSKSAEKDTQQIKFSSRTGVLVQVGHQQNKTVTLEPQKQQFHQNNSVAKHNTTASNSSAQSFPTVVSSHREAPAVSDLLDEDLSSFFLSDPVWDDPADDDLLCEMCDDLENQIQSAVNVPAKQTNQRAALQPSNGHQQQTANQEALLPKKHTQTPCAPGGGLISSVPAGLRGTDSFTYAQVKNTSGSTNSWTCAQGSSRVQTSPQTKPHKGQFTFKKPNNPVATATAKVVGKCSAAEIELKKQQAMERRRQRLQAAQNLRAPT